MKEYVLSVAGIAIISTLCVIIMPKSRLSKFSNGILRLCCVLTILTPLVTLISSFNTFINLEPENTIAVDNSFIDKSLSNYNQVVETQCKKLIEDNFAVFCTVEAEYNLDASVYEIIKIQINVKHNELNQVDEHINSNEIKSFLSERVGVAEEAVIINVSS